MNLKDKIITFFSNIKNRFLELVGKNEQPNESIETEKSLLTDEIANTIFEVENKFSGSMTLKKDILAKIYIDKKGLSIKVVAAIFKVSETTIRRRQKLLNEHMTEILMAVLDTHNIIDIYEVVDILHEYYGPEFEIDNNHNIISINV